MISPYKTLKPYRRYAEETHRATRYAMPAKAPPPPSIPPEHDLSRDKRRGRVAELMADPGHEWTQAQLQKHFGVSRKVIRGDLASLPEELQRVPPPNILKGHTPPPPPETPVTPPPGEHPSEPAPRPFRSIDGGRAAEPRDRTASAATATTATAEYMPLDEIEVPSALDIERLMWELCRSKAVTPAVRVQAAGMVLRAKAVGAEIAAASSDWDSEDGLTDDERMVKLDQILGTG